VVDSRIKRIVLERTYISSYDSINSASFPRAAQRFMGIIPSLIEAAYFTMASQEADLSGGLDNGLILEETLMSAGGAASPAGAATADTDTGTY